MMEYNKSTRKTLLLLIILSILILFRCIVGIEYVHETMNYDKNDREYWLSFYPRGNESQELYLKLTFYEYDCENITSEHQIRQLTFQNFTEVYSMENMSHFKIDRFSDTFYVIKVELAGYYIRFLTTAHEYENMELIKFIDSGNNSIPMDDLREDWSI